jgi:hypothetical protein
LTEVPPSQLSRLGLRRNGMTHFFKMPRAIGERRGRCAGSGSCCQPGGKARRTASSGSRVRVFPGLGRVAPFQGCREAMFQRSG